MRNIPFREQRGEEERGPDRKGKQQQSMEAMKSVAGRSRSSVLTLWRVKKKKLLLYWGWVGNVSK